MFIVISCLSSLNYVVSHSWIEQVSTVDLDGRFCQAAGFPRGNGSSPLQQVVRNKLIRIVLRTSPRFGDQGMTHLLPPDGRLAQEIFPTDSICMVPQQTHNQTEGSPALRASAGAHVALRYQENGHITLTQNDPPGKLSSGTISVYGTIASRPQDTMLEIHGVWDSAGQGGDKRGRLLSRQDFDDGRCYQVNDSPLSRERQQRYPHAPDPLQGQNLWCATVVILPLDLVPGNIYTLYWVWDWPTAPGTSGFPSGKTQVYTTCLDVVII